MKSVVLQQKEERDALLGKVYLKRMLVDGLRLRKVLIKALRSSH